jgi:DNA repair protein RadC
MMVRNKRVCEIIQKYNADNFGSILNSPEAVAEVIKSILNGMDKQDRDKEILFSIGLDAKLKMRYIEIVSIGCLDATIISPRELFRTPFIKGGIASIIIAHNHPSGDVNPSIYDVEMTEKIKNAGKLLDIEVVDHIIVANNGDFYSFRKRRKCDE